MLFLFKSRFKWIQFCFIPCIYIVIYTTTWLLCPLPLVVDRVLLKDRHHRIIRYRMRALSRDRGPIWQTFAHINPPFRIFFKNYHLLLHKMSWGELILPLYIRHFVATIFWLTRDRSPYSMSIISMIDAHTDDVKSTPGDHVSRLIFYFYSPEILQ